MAGIAKKKCQQYSEEYLSYGFIPLVQDNTIPFCLICKNTFTNEDMRPSKMLHHLESSHPNIKEEPLEYFKKLRDKFQQTQTINDMSNESINKSTKALVASYRVSQLIAKNGKPHSITETLLIPAFSDIFSLMLSQSEQEIMSSVPLSNSSVSRQIDEMAINVEEQLIAALQVKKFDLQIDETILDCNESLLLAYVRYTDDNRLIKEMLFAQLLETDTKGETIFALVNNYFKEKYISLENITACSIDGDAAMTDKYKGFIALLKEAVPKIFCIHYVIHREHLFAKNLSCRLHDALSIVIKIVNHIKSNVHQNWLYEEFFQNYDEDFKMLLEHSEVRWLSIDNCLEPFVDLWQSISTFIEDDQLRDQIIVFKSDIFYLVDIFEKLNILNIQLEENNITLITAKGFIQSFIMELKTFWMNFERREYSQFPSLESQKEEIKDDDIIIYVNHLKNLYNDMQLRFHDILNIPEWVTDPFKIDTIDVEIMLHENIIELQNDCAAKIEFINNKNSFWINSELAKKYPKLYEKAQLFIAPLPASYLVEYGFSRVILLLTNERNYLDIVERGDLRLALTTLQPNIEDLASIHMAQGSH